MKKLSFGIKRGLLIGAFGIGGFIFSIALINTSKEILYFKSVNSNVIFESSTSKLEATSFNCTANFVVEENNLVDVSDFQFTIPIDQFTSENKQLEFAVKNLSGSAHNNEVKFVQKQVMVLPIMKMIHLIGYINNEPIALQLAYEINANNELLIKGKQNFRLSDFGIKIPIDLQGAVKNEFDLKLNFRMVEDQRLIN